MLRSTLSLRTSSLRGARRLSATATVWVAAPRAIGALLPGPCAWHHGRTGNVNLPGFEPWSAAASAHSTSVRFPPATGEAKDGGLRWAWHNPYTTTIHAINSAIIKISKLSVAVPVYRGLSGASLPTEFFDKNAEGVCGGCGAGRGGVGAE